MIFNTQEYYHGVVVEIRGKYLGSRGGAQFMHILEELKQSGKRKVVVDLSQTDLVDSAALGTLIAGRETLRQAGGDVRLAGLEARIRHLFLMTHLLGKVFKAYPSREAALESYYEQAAVAF